MKPMFLSCAIALSTASTGCFAELEESESESSMTDADPLATFLSVWSRVDKLAPPGDADGDGVPTHRDCNDHDANFGALLYIDGFDFDNGFFTPPQPLGDDPWSHQQSAIGATSGGQQAVLGQPQSWQDVVVFAQVSSKGTIGCCGSQAQTNRWRAGILLRASLDADQDEGFHGYRCAIGSNATGTGGSPQAGPSTGHFVQLAEFMDAPEDDHCSECYGGTNPTFDQLDKVGYDGVDLAAGGSALLSFSAVGAELRCEVSSTTQLVTTQATDDSFTSGTVGLSTLNMFGQFQSIAVCERFAL